MTPVFRRGSDRSASRVQCVVGLGGQKEIVVTLRKLKITRGEAE